MAFLVRFKGDRVRLYDPSGAPCQQLWHALSLLPLAVGRESARKYIQALRRLLEAARADAARTRQLFASQAEARKAITALLAAAGCRFRHHQLRGGAVLVTAPKPLIASIDAALTALSHCYDLLRDRGELDFDNPVQTPPLDTPLRPDARHPHRHFTLANKPRSLPNTLDMTCADDIRAAARAWPPGIAAAADLLVADGPRPSEILAMDCRDWAAFDFGDSIACSNKGSRGERTKFVYLEPAQRARLVDYVEGPRRAATGLGIAELRALSRTQPDHPALAAPLFLNTLGRRISYSLFNDHYFRPALRRLGSPATPYWARHENTTNAVTKIRAIARDRDEEEQMVNTFAAYKGWATGKKMVDYYSGSLRVADQRALLDRLSGDLAGGAEPASVAIAPRAAAAPPMPAAFAAFLAAGQP